MSTTVDSRVVEMKFDNKDFEKNVSTTLSVLEKLESKIKFAEGTKGLENLGKAAGSVDMSGLSDGVEQVSVKFSALQMVGMAVMNNLVNAAFDIGKNIYSNTIGLLTEGGKQRALNVEQAKLMLKGLKLSGDEIASVFKSADTAVTGTRFGLDEAVKAAAQLKASGVGVGNEMTQSLRAIGGAATMTNSDFTSMAQVFMKVASTGRLMGGELRQLSLKGLAAKEDIMSVYNISSDNYDRMQKKGLITYEMLITTMEQRYGDAAGMANITYSGALTNVQAQVKKIGELWYTSWNEFKRGVFAGSTYIDEKTGMETATSGVIKFVKGIHKGIKTELLGMDPENAMDMGSLYTWLSPIGSAIGDRIGAMDTTPVINMISGVVNICKSLLSMAKPIKDAWGQIFPKKEGPSLILRVSEAFKNFTEKLILTSESGDRVKRTFAGVFTIFRIFGDVLGSVIKVIVDVISTLKSMSILQKRARGEIKDATGGVLEFTASIGDQIVRFREWYKESGYLEKAISKITEVIVNTINHVVRYTKEVKTWCTESETAKSIFAALTEVWQFLCDKFNEYLPIVIDFFSGFFTLIKTNVPFAIDNIKQFGARIKDLGGINFSNIRTAFFEFIDSTKEKFSGANDKITATGTKIKELKDKLIDLFKKIKTPAKSGFDMLFKGFESLTDRFKSLTTSQKLNLGMIASLIGNIFAFKGLTKALTPVTKVLESFSKVGDSLAERIKNFGKPSKLAEIGNLILKIAIAIGVLVASLVVLSKVDSDKLWTSVGALGALVGMAAGLAFVAMLISKFGGDSGKQTGITMLAISASLLILISALKKMEGLNSDSLWGNMAAMAALAGGLALFAKILSGEDAKLSKSALFLLAFTVVFKQVIKLLERMDKLKIKNPSKVIGMFGGIITALAITLAAAKNVKIGAAASLMAIPITLLLLGKAFEQLGKIDFSKIGGNLAIIGGAFLAMLAVVTILGKARDGRGDPLKGVGAMIASLGVVMLSMALMVKIMEGTDWKTIGIVGLAVGLMIGMMAVLVNFTRSAPKDEKVVKAPIMAMAGAIAALVGCVWLLSLIDDKDILKGGGAILAFFAMMAGLMFIASKVKDPEGVKQMLIALSFMVGMMVAMTALVAMVVDPNTIIQTAGSMVGVMGAMALLIYVSSKIKTDEVIKQITMLGTLVGVMAAIGALIFFLSNNIKDPSSALASAGAVAVLMLALSACMAIITKVGVNDENSILKPIACMALLAACAGAIIGLLNVFGGDGLNAIKMAVAVSILIAVMSGCLALMTNTAVVSENKILKPMMCMALLTACAAAILGLLNQFGGFALNALVYAGAVSVLILAMSGCLALLSLVGVSDENSILEPMAAMAFLALAAGFIIGALSVIGTDGENAILTAQSVSILIGAMSACLAGLSLANVTDQDSILKPMMCMALTAACAGAIIGILSAIGVDGPNAISTAEAISGLLAAMSGCLVLIDKCGVSMSFGELIGPLGAMALAAAAGAAILGILAYLDVNPSIETALAISILLGTLTLCLMGLVVVGAAIGPAIAGAVALDAFIIIVGALILGIGALFEQFPGLEPMFDKGIEILKKLGTGLGEAIGGFIGGIVGGFMEQMPGIADNLSEFMNKLQPFIDGAKKIDQTSMDGVARIVAMMLLITGEGLAASIGDAIAGIFNGGKTTMDKFGEGLIAFGTAIVDFSNIVKDLDAEALNGVSSAAEKIVALVMAIDPSVVSNSPFKDSAFESFTSGLVMFGEKIVEFGNVAKSMDISMLLGTTILVSCMSPIIDLINAIPAQQVLTEKGQSMSPFQAFISGLNDFIPVFQAYGIAAGNLTFIGDLILEGTNILKNSMQSIVALIKSLPDDKLLVGKNQNVSTFQAFIDGLSAFIPVFQTYGIAAGNLTFIGDLITEGTNILRTNMDSIVGLIKSLPEEQLLTKGQNIFGNGGASVFGSFIEGMNAFIPMFVDYGDKVSTLVGTKISAGTTILKRNMLEVIALIEEIPEDVVTAKGGLFGTSVGAKNSTMMGFVIGLGEFTEKFSEYGVKVSELPPNLSSGTGTLTVAMKAIFDMMNAIPVDMVTNTGGLFGTTLGGQDPMSQFAKGLGNFVDQIKEYGTKVADLPEGLIAKSRVLKHAMLEIISMMTAVPTIDGGFDGVAFRSFYVHLGPLGENFKKFADKIKDLAEGTSGKAEIMNSAISPIVSFVTRLKDTSADNLDAFGTKITDFATQFMTYITTINPIDETAITKNQTVMAVIDRIKTTINNGDSPDFTSFSTGIAQIGSGISSFATSIADIKSTDLGTVETQIKQIIDLVNNIDATAFNTAATKCVTEFNTGLNSQTATINNSISALLTGIATTVSTSLASGAFKTKGTELCQQIIDGIDSVVPTLTTVLDSPLVSLYGRVVLTYTNFLAAGTRLAQGVEDGLKANATIPDALTGALGVCCTTIRMRYQSFHDAGLYLVQGFEAGIRDNVYKITAIADYMADQAIKAAKKKLETGSPSKVFAQIGEWTVFGFVKGIGDNVSAVEDASAEMADASTSGFNSAIQKLSEFLDGNMECQPIIRPILDLSSIQNGVGNLRNMLNMDYTYAMANNIALMKPGNAMMYDMISSAIDRAFAKVMPTQSDQNVVYEFKSTIDLDGKEVGTGIAKYVKSELDQIEFMQNRQGGIK